MTETVAFLVSDIEGSTRLVSSLGSDVFRDVIADYREIIAEAASEHEGRIIARDGDGLFLAFSTAPGAVRAATQAQRRLAAHTWPDDHHVRARMAVHAGEAVALDDDYVGLDLHRTARIGAAGHGGQVLVSEAARALAVDTLPDDVGIDDLGEHRLKDLDRRVRIYQLTLADLPGDFPPLRTLESTPNNLPIQPTSFVGRENELADAVALIRDNRLVTVTGVGGTGKTRLALQSVAELIPDFPDGIWLVELAPITDPDHVDGALVDALGLPQPSGEKLRDVAIDYLSSRTSALVVDNCEHLIDAASDLVTEIIVGAPSCTVIATSRELLGVPGEAVYGLQPMGLPDRRAVPTADELSKADAVCLFVERAGAVRPGFHLTDDNAHAIGEICRRVDGMPLAIELAASRLRTFSAEKIAELLNQRFRLLTGGSRSALPRQQTLVATIEWSYRLLDDVEQAFFRRLSVFHGGFTYDAAASVATDESVDEIDALELLPSLVDKSLVLAEEVEHGEVRYRLLETLRQFARERLDETGTGDDVRRRHADYFRDLAIEAADHAIGPDELHWKRRIRPELSNLREALNWSLEADRPVDALEIAVRFARFAVMEGRRSEALAPLEQALDAASDQADRLLLARALVAHGILLDFFAEHDRAVEQCERGVEIFRALDADGADPELLRGSLGYPRAIIALAVVLFHQGRIGERNEIFTELVQEALEVARRLDDEFGIASALGNLAHHMDPQGDPDDSRRLFADAVAATRELGSDRMLAGVNQQRAFFEFDAGDLEASRNAWESAVRHAEQSEDENLASVYRACLAAVEVELGDHGAAERFVSNMRGLFGRSDIRQGMSTLQTPIVLRAGIDAAAERYERVAIAVGASRTEADRGTPVRWDLVDHVERVTDAAREALGEEPFEARISEGAAMSRDEIADFLIED